MAPSPTGKETATGVVSGRTMLVVLLAALLALPYAVEHIAPAMTPETLPPMIAYTAVMSSVAYLDRLLNALTPPNLAVFRAGMGMVHTAELYTVAKLGIADAIHDTPISSLDIAKAITSNSCAENADGPATCSAVAWRVTRLLRSTSTYGVFRETPAGAEVWVHTAQSRFIAKKHEASMHAVLLNFGDVQFRMMSELHHTVVSGEAAFKRVHGQEFWSWYEQHPDQHAVFDATMHQLGRLGGADAAVAADVPWNRVSEVVDVGGGHGLQAATILAYHKGMNGTVFDMPHVTARALAQDWQGLPSSSVRPRMRWVGGDMFDPSTVPGPHATAKELAKEKGETVCVSQVKTSYGYALRDILHDWPDEDCVRILSSLRANMRSPSGDVCYGPDGGRVDKEGQGGSGVGKDRVFIIGRLIVPGASFVGSLGSQDADIVMLAAFGTTAGERTVGAYGSLLSQAGLRIVGVHNTRSHYAVVEAEAV